MARPFTCSNCGITTTKRAHFTWLLAIVGFFHAQISDIPPGPLCTRCAPTWSTTFGKALYVLLAVCIVLLLWQLFAPSSQRGVTPNSRLLSDASTPALRASSGAPKPER